MNLDFIVIISSCDIFYRAFSFYTQDKKIGGGGFGK